MPAVNPVKGASRGQVLGFVLFCFSFFVSFYEVTIFRDTLFNLQQTQQLVFWSDPFNSLLVKCLVRRELARRGRAVSLSDSTPSCGTQLKKEKKVYELPGKFTSWIKDKLSCSKHTQCFCCFCAQGLLEFDNISMLSWTRNLVPFIHVCPRNSVFVEPLSLFLSLQLSASAPSRPSALPQHRPASSYDKPPAAAGDFSYNIYRHV